MARVSMRGEILDAALEQFWQKGFHGTGIQDIATAAGAPKGSVYNHFKSKEELATAALEEWGKTRQLEMLTNKDVPGHRRIRQNFQLQADEFINSGLRRGCFLGNLSAEVADTQDGIQQELAASFKHWQDGLELALADAAADGHVLSSLPYPVLAQHILGSWEGALLTARATRSAEPLDAFFTVVFGGLLTAGE